MPKSPPPPYTEEELALVTRPQTSEELSKYGLEQRWLVVRRDEDVRRDIAALRKKRAPNRAALK